MKTTFTTLCLFVNLLLLAQAPEIEWSKNFGGSGNDYIYGSSLVLQTSDGGYIFAGETSSNDHDVSNNHGDTDIWIVKINETGNIEWEKTFGGEGYDAPNSLQHTDDGGYVVGGGTTLPENMLMDYYMLKLDQAGNVEWEKTYGGSQNEFARSVHQAPDGGYILGGHTFSTDGDIIGNTDGNYGMWIIKTDESGEMEWQKFYSESTFTYLHDLKLTSDGGYIVAGAKGHTIVGQGPDYDFWVLKLDSAGELEWDFTFGEECGLNCHDYAETVIETQDGNFVVAGYAFSSGIIGLEREADAIVIKLSSSGEMEWSKNYGGSGYELFASIGEMPDGGFLCGGWTNSGWLGSADGDVSELTGLNDIWVVRLDEEGNIMWEKTYGGPHDPNYPGDPDLPPSGWNDLYSEILFTNDGGYLLGGATTSNTGDVPGHYGGGYDIWVVKLSAESMGITETEEANLYLYPNPTTGIINIQAKEKINSVSVYNLAGQRMSIHSLSKENTSIDISNLPRGTYFVEVTLNNNKSIKRYKVIKK